MDKWVITVLIVCITFVSLISATPSFLPGSVRTQMNLAEDLFPSYFYNFSMNVTNTSDDTLPLIFSLKNVSSGMYLSQTLPSFYSWFRMNSSTGILTINATNDNQTGRFNITIEVSNSNTQPSGIFDLFYFIINSTNDFPIFTSIFNEYNFSEGNFSQYYLNATDEESQYPLIFNISFVNCSLSGFSTRSNCSLFNLINSSNTSAMINFTPSSNDIGIYYANISVRDAASNFNTCNSSYCAPDYFINKTTYHSQLVTFNVFSSIWINASNCQNKIFQHGSLGSCNLSIYSKGPTDSLNVSSYAFLRNSDNEVTNRTWFYANNSFNASNFIKNITINVTPSRTEVGNWTINFSVMDLTYGILVVEPINIIVNRTSNSLPDILNLSYVTTSINLLTNINLLASDDDFLIPDKNLGLGGFNETISFNVDIFNRSNPSQRLNLTNFSPIIQSMPVIGTNRTVASISFTPNSSEAGNYTVNITVHDFENATDTTLFNLTILRNNAPQWASITNNFIYYEGNNTYLNLSSNVSDSDGDLMTFSYTSDTSFSSFSINASTGIINFTNQDEDIGQHLVSIISTDGLGLSSNVTINFTIYNFNEAPYFRPIIQSYVDNCTVVNATNLNCNEKNLIRIRIWTEDDDFKIPAGQKSFYDENLILLLNISGPNSTLFSFTNFLYPPNSGSNLSIFGASFTPGRNDVGDYNISLNISDNSGRSALFNFNLSIIVFEDAPVLTSLVNQTTAVSRNLIYHINASDDENGYSNVSGGNSNFTFSYVFLNGSDFINSNSSFNTTTGLLNYTFNSSQGGSYRLNVTVRDSTNRLDSEDFWINVYNIPNVTFPSTNYSFSLSENVSQNLTFQSNHSMQNNLTYIFSLYNWNSSRTVLYNFSYFGNNSNLTIPFTPDFNNETNGIMNISLFVYPSDNNLANANELNLTQFWNLTISHTNFPLTNYSIPLGGINRLISGTSPKSFELDDFFYDIDATDPLHNQSIYFNYTTLTGGCPMTVSLSNWINRSIPTINFSSTTTSSCNFTVTGFEYNESNISQLLTTLESNNFSVELSIDTQIITQTVTQSSSVSRSVSLRIITPGLVSVFPYQTISIPITIENNGQYAMSSIALNYSVLKDKISTNLVDVTLSPSAISSLGIGEKRNLTLIISPRTSNIGYYDVVLNATSVSPVYTAFGHVYFSIGKVNDSEIKKYLLFAEEFLTQNKQCSELKEYIKVAYDYFNQDKFGDARLKAEEAVNACKNRLGSTRNIVELIRPQKNFVVYFAGSVLLAFILGIGYYLIKRHRLKRGDAIKIYGD